MSVKNLRMYNEAVDIATEIALLVRGWDAFYRSTLGGQCVRAADSISTNIAEGYGRMSPGDRFQFLFYAEGSCQETKNQILLAERRGIIDSEHALLLLQRLTSLSISIMAFCKRDLERHPNYQGSFRSHIERRTSVLNRTS